MLQCTPQLSPVAPHIQGHLLNTLLCFTTFLTDKRRIWGQFVKPQAIIDHSLEDHSDINKAGARWVAKRTHFSCYYGNNYQGLHILLFTWSMANSYISFYFQSCRSHTGPNSTSSSPYCPLLCAADWSAPVTLLQSGGSAHVGTVEILLQPGDNCLLISSAPICDLWWRGRNTQLGCTRPGTRLVLLPSFLPIPLLPNTIHKISPWLLTLTYFTSATYAPRVAGVCRRRARRGYERHGSWTSAAATHSGPWSREAGPRLTLIHRGTHGTRRPSRWYN